jgi:predicted metal-dependent enzyme (double-stranded beta helix superfamily)
MAPGSDDWARFVRDLQAITTAASSHGAISTELRPLVRQLALSREWVQPHHYECHPVQGFGVHVLHEEVNHELWVVAFSWLPGRGAPPHDHRTWAVVAAVQGYGDEHLLEASRRWPPPWACGTRADRQRGRRSG